MHKVTLAVLLAIAAPAGVAAQHAPDPFADYNAGRYGEAVEGAEAALIEDPQNPVWWALAAEARAKLGESARAADAFAKAAQFEPDNAKRSYFLRAQALQLVYAGNQDAAREIVRAAMADPALGTRASLDWAMVAISAHDDASAQEILDNEALYEGFSRQTALDAAYSAKRRGLDRRAVRFFETGLALDGAGADPLSPADREGIRRENRELTRDWSFLLQGSYSSAGGPIGPANIPSGDERAYQLGGEISRRIGGWRNGKPFSVFARFYHSEFPSDDAPAGNATQGWVGVRYKPISALNFNLEASRLVGIDHNGIDDWSLRGAISGGEGLEPATGRRSMAYVHYYADLSHLFENEVTYGLAEGRFGRSFMLDERTTTFTPYAVARVGLDSGRAEEWALGAGLGVSLRHWFGESSTVAHRGFIDLDIQAREKIAGDRRASAVLATMTLGR